ncbi:hypothetical protein HK100_000087 [Physocladia obscura]|uniref:Uncharacterized protein n=1 Tax=Physocladia obscura TaxID=109957 RepID=A0AAD5T9L9_9FUNG|nr:hypothetical protein HK100_000087 [Physocladia obscura]
MTRFDLQKIKEDFKTKPVPYTPETRRQTAREIEQMNGPIPEDNTKPKPQKQADTAIRRGSDGRILQRNEGKWLFKVNSIPQQAILVDIEISKFLDSSFINVQVETKFVQVVIKNKVLTVVFDDEVRPDTAVCERSKISGKLLVTVIRADAPERLDVETILNTQKNIKSVKSFKIKEKKFGLERSKRNERLFGIDSPELQHIVDRKHIVSTVATMDIKDDFKDDPDENSADAHSQENQDADFFLCETEFQTTLDNVSNNPDLEKFKAEYEKMHKAVLRSRHHTMVLTRQHQEFDKEYKANAVIVEESSRLVAGDTNIIKQLKEKISTAVELIDTTNKNEENLREELRQLRLDINSLSAQLKQGVGLSANQERTLNELIASKDTLTRELESEFDKIVALRNSITEVTDKIRITDQLKSDTEHHIYNLKERNAEKRAEIDSETRNKERLERDLRELRIVVAVKSQDVRVKQDAVKRATEDISILESQIRTQRQMLDKLAKARDGLIARTAKLRNECGEQIGLTAQIVRENEELVKELKEREAKLHKNRVEVKKVNKMKETLVKKNKLLEDQKVEAEIERKSLRAESQAKLIEIDKTKRSIDNTKKNVDDLVREHDILENNRLKSQDETSKNVDATVLLRQNCRNIEVELGRENKDIAHQLTEIKHLEEERDRCIKEAERLQTLCVDGMQKIKQKETEIFEFKRKMIQSETKLKHKQNLYEAVQSDRNLHAKHLIESQSEISEMKRRLKVMNYQINGYKQDLTAKYESLAKEETENSKLSKDIEIISDEVKTLKNQNELAQAYIRSQLAEEMKLNQFVKDADLERMRQENALQVLISERDNLSAQLIRQNEELAKAYHKIKTQQSSLIRSEIYYKDKLKEVQTLTTILRQMRQQEESINNEIADMEPNKKLIRKLAIDITREKTRIKALEDELENPINVHRWRKLEGSNPKAYEMIQLLHTLQKNLIAKTNETKDKELLIQNKEQLYLHLKSVLAKQVGPEAIEQVEEFQKILKQKKIQLKHMNVELNMYHAQVREYKHGLGGLNRSLKQVKDDYFALKISGKFLPRLPSKISLQLPPISMSRNSVVAIAAGNDTNVHTEKTTNTISFVGDVSGSSHIVDDDSIIESEENPEDQTTTFIS